MNLDVGEFCRMTFAFSRVRYFASLVLMFNLTNGTANSASAPLGVMPIELLPPANDVLSEGARLYKIGPLEACDYCENVLDHPLP